LRAHVGTEKKGGKEGVAERNCYMLIVTPTHPSSLTLHPPPHLSKYSGFLREGGRLRLGKGTRQAVVLIFVFLFSAN